MIGIFDSGSGGLTVLRAIRNRLPSADVVYFGDIQNAPYGSRSRKELSQLTVSAMQRLSQAGATSIVSACNSVSASLAVSLFDTLSITPERLIEMVGPTVSEFKNVDAPVLLCATEATINSEIYQNAFHMIGKEIETVPLPELAGAIEAGKSEEEIEKLIRDSFASVSLKEGTILVLACTHYPLVKEIFTRVLGEGVNIFDPAEAVAQRVEKEWWPREVRTGQLRFLISQDSEPFRTLVAKFFPDSAYTIEVVE